MSDEHSQKRRTVWRVVIAVPLLLLALYAITGFYMAFGVFVGLPGPDMPIDQRASAGAVFGLIALVCFGGFTLLMRLPR